MGLPPAPVERSVRLDTTMRPPLRGRRLFVLRAVWFAVFTLVGALLVLAVPTRISGLHTMPAPIFERIVAYGLPASFLAYYLIAFELLLILTFTAAALAIFWLKSDDWMTIFTSLALLVFGAASTPFLDTLAARGPSWAVVVGLISMCGQAGFLIFLYIFPDGRFIPRWTALLAVLWAGWLAVTTLFPNAPFNPQQWSGSVAFLVSLAFYSTGVAAQIHRLRRFSTPVAHQQTKWVQFGLTAAFLGYASNLPLVFFPWMNGGRTITLLVILVLMPLQSITLALVPLAIGLSLFRFRLWDIDPLINQTLVYGILTGGLSVAYFGSVVLLQQLFAPFIRGQQSTLAIILSTLVIATLFKPLRKRLQRVIDRLFYREKVDAQEAFTVFSRELRTIIELPDLLRILVHRVTSLLHISNGAVFLRDGEGRLHLAEASRHAESSADEAADAPHSALLALDGPRLQRLASAQPVTQAPPSAYPLLVPLTAPRGQGAREGRSAVLLGVLALGPRLSGQGYSRADQTLLMGLADQAGTAIYVARLIAERQAEARRNEEAERRLAEYRSSPAGRAEAMARNLLAAPADALLTLYQLAQQAGRDPDAASLVANLPTVLDNLNAGPIAGFAEWVNYLVNSQFVPELLPVGLRTLITQLELVTSQQASVTIKGAEAALSTYRMCQLALDAVSIAHIADFSSSLDEAAAVPPDAWYALRRAIAELHPVTEALRAYERLDATPDKLAYLAAAVERLRRVDQLARSELGSADRPIVQRIAENWMAAVTGAMLELQTRAQVLCQLLTRRAWQDDVVVLALSLRNEGRGAALNLRVSLLPAPEYTLLDEPDCVARLAPGEEVQVALSVQLCRSAVLERPVGAATRGPRPEGGVEWPDRFRARFAIRYTDPRGADQVEQFADVVHLLAGSGEFQFIPNPYVVGTPLQPGSQLFFGREDVISAVQDNLAAGHRNNLVLIGQRRTGKTSLLKQLGVRLGDAYMPVYLDGQAMGLDPGMANFFLALATEIAFALEDRGFAIDLPEADAFAARPAAVFEHQFLAQVRTLIGARHLLLLIDEFEELEAAVRRGKLDPSIFGFFRHLIQHTDNLSVIFCGTHRLEELAADYWSVLFNISLYRHVGVLERDEALRLVQEPVAKFGMLYDDLGLDKIWRVTAGHPYFLQLLCHSLVNRHNKTRRSYVTVADVNAALDEILASGEAHFVYLWSESSQDERLVLVALSRLLPLTGSVMPMLVFDYLNERGVSIERRAVHLALHRLALRDVLRTESSTDAVGVVREPPVFYRWQLGLLGLWVEKYRSLARVVEEVRS